MTKILKNSQKELLSKFIEYLNDETKPSSSITSFLANNKDLDFTILASQFRIVYHYLQKLNNGDKVSQSEDFQQFLFKPKFYKNLKKDQLFSFIKLRIDTKFKLIELDDTQFIYSSIIDLLENEIQDNNVLNYAKGYFYFKCNEYKDSLKYFSQITESSNTKLEIELVRLKYMASSSLEMHKDAINHLFRLLELSPSHNLDINELLANEYSFFCLKKSNEYYEKCIELITHKEAISNPNLGLKKMSYLKKLNRLTEAIELGYILQENHKLKDNLDLLYLLLYELFKDIGHKKSANFYYNKLIELNPNIKLNKSNQQSSHS